MKILRYILSVVLCCFFFAANADSLDYASLKSKSSEELMSEGRAYFEKRDPANAQKCFRIVCERINDKNVTTSDIQYAIRALNNIGCVYKHFYYDYPRAYEYFTQAYNLCEKHEYIDFLPVVLVNLGDLLNDYGTFYKSDNMLKQAEKIFSDCFDRAIEMQNWELMTTAFFNLANRNYSLNLNRYARLFEKNIPSDTPDLAYVRLLYRAIENIQNKNYAEARRCFNEQFNVINTRWEADRDKLAARLGIAETYRLEQNYPEMVSSLGMALDIAVENDIRDLAAQIYAQLSESYQKMGDDVNSKEYRLLYLEEMERMTNARMGNIGELIYLNEIDRQKQAKQTLEMKQRVYKYIVISVCAVLLTVILFVIIIWRKNKQLKELNRSLYEKYQQSLNTETLPREDKYQNSNLTDTRRNELVLNIQQTLEDSEIICQQGFSSKQMADRVKSNTTYISQIINETYNTSFSNVLGQYRVKEACRRIRSDKAYRNLTIEAIANSVGFKSRSSFLTAFKREVGICPSEYIRIASKEVG